MSFNPDAGTPSSIAGSSDVALDSLQNDQVLAYDQSAAKWQNKVGGGAPTLANLPAGSTLTVWWDTDEAVWPSRPTERTDIYIRWCSIGDNGVPSGALPGVDTVAVFDNEQPPSSEWGNIVASYNFESDTATQNVAPSSPWSSVGGATQMTAETAAAIHGDLGGRITSAASNRYLQHNSGAAHDNTRVIDLFITVHAISANSVFASINDSSGPTTRGDARVNADRTVTIRNGAVATATSTTILALDTTYRISWHVSATGQQLRIYNAAGTLLETITGVLTTLTHNQIRVGLGVQSAGYSADYDTIRIGDDWLAPYA